MILKRKKLLSLLLSLIVVITMSSTAWASTTEQIEPYGVYIRECVAFEPNYTSVNYTHKYLGSVSGDNRKGSNPLQISYSYETSGTTTASITGYTNVSVEANVVFGKIQAETGIEVTGSRSWTKGTSSGASYSIPPGRFEIISVYIPAIATAGRFKYKVYMDGYENDFFYEYKTLSASYAPQKSSIHFTISSASSKGVPEGTTVYTPYGKYFAQ